MTRTPQETILKLAIPVPLPGLFDYLPPREGPCPPPGARVLAPFGRRRLVGVVVGHSDRSELPRQRLVRAIRVLDDCQPLLNTEMLGLLQWCWRYYKHAPGEVVFNALPPALRVPGGTVPAAPLQYRLTAGGRERLAEGAGRAPAQWGLLKLMEHGPASPESLRQARRDWRKVLARLGEQGWVAEEMRALEEPAPQAGPKLTREQAGALEAIRDDRGRFRCHLLDGVTGSGKTEIYLKLVEETLRSERQALVLVPEIGLTPQLVRRFHERLGLQPAVYHSGLSDGERLRVWAAARRGDARLLLGTRSALFLPLPKAGLLIMDESHDASFKQQDGFRFSARDVAVKRASGLQIPVVLGTATPSLETVHNAARGRYAWHRLRDRATGAAQPGWRVVDLCGRSTEAGLSDVALEAIAAALERREQVLVFLNRRGYAPVLLCHECGWHGTCRRCDANLTWHRSGNSLVCHHCGHMREAPRLCPDCSADALHGAGAGTEQLERFLGRRFPDFPLYRFDRDRTRHKGAFEEMYRSVREGRPAVLVGTQMLAKGHHFPRVTLAVIVNLDQALYSGDFRAMERMGQLMMQVAGRAGRAERPGEVLLQTFHPEHPLLGRLLEEGYERFAMELLAERRLSGLPPMSHQAVLRAEAGSREPVQAFLQAAMDEFPGNGASVFGPFPAQMERRGGRWRWYLLVQGRNRPGLQTALDRWLPAVRGLSGARSVRWAIDVDPQEF
ncbi:MAG: primosomal protein N' [Xanthomonadales bacterium]|nr:primosomal protein N' [Xanthomonadales bacterium]NIX11551.1 primosomal protein N' [Xanthomonadales bacterium]